MIVKKGSGLMRAFSFHGLWSVKEERNETTWRSPYLKMHGKRLRPSPARRGLDLGDGTHIIYVNGATRSATEIGKLMHDLRCRDAAKMYFDLLRKRVGEFKNSEEGRHAMCRAMERIAERKKAEGKRETMLATAKRMLKDGVLALKDIARYSGLSLTQVKKLQASMA